jgi:hypothetical protein
MRYTANQESPYLLESKGSLQCSQKLTTGPCSELM